MLRPRCAIKPRMRGFDKGEIVGRVHGQPSAFARQRRIGRRPRDGHEIGMKLEIARDMLARDRIVAGVRHQLVEAAPGQRVDAFMGAKRALFHHHIIAILLDQAGDQMIDEACIQEGRIGRNPHDDVGIEQFGGAGKPGKHIVFRARAPR